MSMLSHRDVKLPFVSRSVEAHRTLNISCDACIMVDLLNEPDVRDVEGLETFVDGPSFVESRPATTRGGNMGRRLSLFGVLFGSAILHGWALTSVGWGNAYYSAAARSMGTSWKSFFFASLDSSNFVSVDKPPMALWVQVLSTKIFGYTQFALLIPEALAGTAAVLLLYVGTRRSWGHAAGLAAAAALAVTPIFVAVNHTNVMDSVLVFFMTATAVTAVEAMRQGQLRWLLLASVLGGCAVTAKMAAALPVLPGLLVAYLWCAPRSWRTRVWRTALAAVVLMGASLSWFAAVWATPKSERPYVGSTQKNSVFELAVERNGVNQVEGGAGVGGGFGGARRGGFPAGGFPAGGFPNGGPPAGGFPNGGPSLGGLLPGDPTANNNLPTTANPTPNAQAGANPSLGSLLPGTNPGGATLPQAGNTAFGGRPGAGPGGGGGGGVGAGFGVGFAGGTAGPFRLLNSDLGNQIGWLIPLGLLGALGALLVTGLRGSKRLGAVVVFGAWFSGAAIVFSITKGIVHPYYTAQLAPPLAALVGIGFGAWFDDSTQLGHSSQLGHARLRSTVAVVWPMGLVATVFGQWIILRRIQWQTWLPFAVVILATLAIVCLLFAEVARRSSRRFPGAATNMNSARLVRIAVFASVLLAPLRWTQGALAAGVSGNLPYANPLANNVGGRLGGGIAPNGGTTFSTAETDPLVRYLRAQRKDEDWLVAVPSAGSAEPIIIRTGEPVMALGGFVGSDPTLSDAQLSVLVKAGRIRFFLAADNSGGIAGFGGRGGVPFGGGSHSTWITTNCLPVDTTLWQSQDSGSDTSQVAGRAFPGGPTAGNYALYDCGARREL